MFSKWFSESGKLVVKMFEKIRELIEDPEALVCILMDEVRMHSIPLRVLLPCVTVWG